MRDQSVRPEYWLAAIGAIGNFIFDDLFSVLARCGALMEDKSRIRRRSAVSRAKNRFNEGKKLLNSRKVEQGADEIRMAICGLLADLDDSCESGMTPGDARRKLQNLDLDASLVDRVEKTLETCDATRYSGSSGAVGLADAAGSVLDEMVHLPKKSEAVKMKRYTFLTVMFISVFAIALGLGGCNRVDLDTAAKFQEGRQGFCQRQNA